MKLTNKVTNAFFALMAVISLFMPIVGYSTLLTGDSFNLVDMIRMLSDIDTSAGSSLLDNLGTYGFRGQAITVVIFFVLMLVCLVATLVLSFVNVPYLVRTAVTGLGFASYIVAVSCFLSISAGFVKGVIPTSAITSLAATGGAENVLSTLLSSFASITKMGIAAGAYVGLVSFGVLFLANLVFFIFRKRFAAADGEPENTQKKVKKHHKVKKQA